MFLSHSLSPSSPSYPFLPSSLSKSNKHEKNYRLKTMLFIIRNEGERSIVKKSKQVYWVNGSSCVFEEFVSKSSSKSNRKFPVIYKPFQKQNCNTKALFIEVPLLFSFSLAAVSVNLQSATFQKQEMENFRNQQFMSFKLGGILSSMVKSRAVPLGI